VVDTNGEPVGYIDLLFADEETGRPEWMGIWNGVWRTRPRVLAPIHGVDVVEDEIRLPYTKKQVQDAPSYDDEDDRGLFSDDSDAIGISPEKELSAYRHYGLEPLSPQAAAPRLRAWKTQLRAVELHS
jgi:hypothetical protein